MSTCIALKPTPIFNTPDFFLLERTELPLDEKGLFRPLEMIALPNTKFQVIDRPQEGILKVTTQDYPGGPYYIQEKLVTFIDKDHPDREKVMPAPSQILTTLQGAVGLPYIWGGNYKGGIGPHFRGLDCSGLLYEATGGFTPRNTSELMTFGEKIENFSNVKRLDILVWPGHVIIFLSPNTTIESLHPQGVVTRDSKERLLELQDKNYVIRRFVP